MSELIEIEVLPDRLRQLLGSGALPEGARATGNRLLERLEADIRVVIAGPARHEKAVVFDALAARKLRRTAITELEMGGRLEGADICLWCTAAFSPSEQAIWSAAPDRLKDHSFLVPLADRASAAERLGPDRMQALDDIAAEEFYGLYPILLPDNAEGEKPAVFEELFSEVARIVRSGRNADADNARMFLATHEPKVPYKPAGEDRPAGGPVAKPKPAEPETPDVERSELKAHQAALDILKTHTSALEPHLNASTDAAFAQILAICEETGGAVSEAFSHHESRHADFVRAREGLQSAADEILLLSIEGGVGPALAAVTTLLQIKRELEVEVAAASSSFT